MSIKGGATIQRSSIITYTFTAVLIRVVGVAGPATAVRRAAFTFSRVTAGAIITAGLVAAAKFAPVPRADVSDTTVYGATMAPTPILTNRTSWGAAAASNCRSDEAG